MIASRYVLETSGRYNSPIVLRSGDGDRDSDWGDTGAMVSD